MAHFSKNTLSKLEGVHPDLVAVAHRAAEIGDLHWQISCGLRTIEEQRDLVAKGLSTTMRSRHITGHAIDVFATSDDGKTAYWAAHFYPPIIDAIKQAARELGVAIDCGIDWKNFRGDVYHVELDRDAYPANDPADAKGIEEPAVVIRFGMTGDEVGVVQALLRSIGHPIKVDGDFGPKTRRAVLEFQANHGLEITGDVGKETLIALQKANEDEIS